MNVQPLTHRPLTSPFNLGSMLPDLRHSLQTKVQVALDYAWFVLALSGASLAAAFGRGLLALLLAALALGLGRRLVARQKRAASATSQVPAWVKAGSLALSVAEVAVLVQVTGIAARLQHEGVSWVHAMAGFVALAAAYLIQLRLFAALSRRLFASNAKPRKYPAA